MKHTDWTARAIALATGFVVTRYLGSGKYERVAVAATLDAAREAKRAAGLDEHGRPALIYALVPGQSSVHVG